MGDSKPNAIQTIHEFIEIEEAKQQPLNLAEKIDQIVKLGSNKDDFQHFFETNNTREELDYLLIEFRFTDALSALEYVDVANLSKKCRKKSQVILLVCEAEEVWRTFWKSKENEEFLELMQPKKLKWEENLNLCKFVANFLAKSLELNYLGKS